MALCFLVYALRDSALFPNLCEKKAAYERRPESREETPKEASAAAMLHCNNDSGRNFVQWERQISGLPLFFAKLRDFGASLLLLHPTAVVIRFPQDCFNHELGTHADFGQA